MEKATPVVNVDDARGLAFACLPGCGFCCTASPFVHATEAAPLGALVQRAPDGALRIPVKGLACGALREDRTCGVYERRPAVCRLYPYQVHAGRRLQVVVSLACPGVAPRAVPHPSHAGAVHPAADADDMQAGAREAAAFALAQPGAAAQAAEAKRTFGEFDRRMREWGAEATPDRLRAGFLPHAASIADPAHLPAFFEGLRDGALLFDGRPERAVGALFDAEPSTGLADLLEEAARDAFDGPSDALWVEPGHAWTVPTWRDGVVRLGREGGPSLEASPRDTVVVWRPEARALLTGYVERLMRRDHAEGAAAWLVDQSGYQATLPAAYGRVLGEAALQVILRAGLLAFEQGVSEVDVPLATRGVAAYETSFHSLPTIGSVL